MIIRYFSDLHIEFDNDLHKIQVPVKPEDKYSVLVLPGDICVAWNSSLNKAKQFFQQMANQFAHVVYVMGNHEHYGGKFSLTYQRLKDAVSEFDNIHILEKETLVVDNTIFIGATLWTGMNNDVWEMQKAKLWMNDYNCIRTGPKEEPWRRKLTPIDTVQDHMNARGFIFREIEKNSDMITVVVTHHAPCYLSVPQKLKTSNLNSCYVTELLDIYDEIPRPDLWIHGHIHESSSYTIEGTKVLSNPRGYESIGEHNPEFTLTRTILIDK